VFKEDRFAKPFDEHGLADGHGLTQYAIHFIEAEGE